MPWRTMNPDQLYDAFQHALKLCNPASLGAAAVNAAGLFSWLAGNQADDEEVADAHEFVLDALSDADAVRTVECVTDRNLRDQITVEEAEALYAESQRRRFGWRWN